ncbi:DEAD/DEAH box helicase [Alishewanella longhuensis]
MKLRCWQAECSKKALGQFKTGKKHFMALATPGAGKTVMAATVAKYLYAEGLIDYVICFAPSVAVQKSMEYTFAKILGRPMHSKLGAIGGVFTYQYLTTSKSADWSFLQSSRVFAVFDEIHHCGGQDTELSNSWGREILTTISNNVRYILSMTGTPWRTDHAPISLARYIEPDFTIELDYIYGLEDAIIDNVCRLPEITLIDNDNLSVNYKNYSSLCLAMTEADFNTDVFSTILKPFDTPYHSL